MPRSKAVDRAVCLAHAAFELFDDVTLSRPSSRTRPEDRVDLVDALLIEHGGDHADGRRPGGLEQPTAAVNAAGQSQEALTRPLRIATQRAGNFRRWCSVQLGQPQRVEVDVGLEEAVEQHEAVGPGVDQLLAT